MTRKPIWNPSYPGLHQAERFETVAELFKQLGDTTRLRIFWLLCHTEQCVINISALMEMSSPAVSHHLRALRGCNLIVSRREGKEVYYRAADNFQTQLLHKAMERVLAIACPERRRARHETGATRDSILHSP